MPDITSTSAPSSNADGLAEACLADVFAASLEQAGIEAAIGLDDPQPLFASLRDSSLRTVLIHDERSGAFMADGYARATQRPALCAAVAGPGATNLATGLLESFRASSPMIAVVGEPPTARPGVRGFQGLPHEAVLGPVCKSVIRIEDPKHGARAVAHAAALASTGRPGPVLLIVANDLWQQAAGETAAPVLGATLSAPGLVDGLAEAAAALAGAACPLIVAGGGAVTANAREAVTRLAEVSGVPVATTLLGKGSIDERHPLAVGVASAYTGGASANGRVATSFLGEADLVLIIGSDLDPVTTCGGAWPSPGARVVRIDIDPAELTTYPGLQLLGDARLLTEALVRQFNRAPVDGAANGERQIWVKRISEARADQLRHVADRDGSAEGDGVWPGALVRKVERHMVDGDAIVTDASYSSAWALDRFVQTHERRTVIAPRGSGVLGWGLPGALGVKLGRPDRRVTCLTGDGGLYFSIGEMESAVRLGLPLTLVLLNNRSYAFQWHADRHRLGRDNADLHFARHVDYRLLAEAFGWRSAEVSTVEEFETAFVDAARSDAPTFIDVPVDREVFPPLVEFDP